MFGDGWRGVSALHNAFQSLRGTDGVLTSFESIFSLGKDCHFVLCDAVKYFDLLNYDVIVLILEEMGVTTFLVEHMLSSWRDADCTLQTAFGPTEPFRRKSGCPQGAPASVTVSMLVMNLLVAALEEPSTLLQHVHRSAQEDRGGHVSLPCESTGGDVACEFANGAPGASVRSRRKP